MKQLLSFFLSLIALALPSSGLTAEKSAAVYSEQQTSILVSRESPEFTIKLKANPTTGYSWFLRNYDSRYLEQTKHHFQAAENKKLVGAPGYELWSFKVKQAAFSVLHHTTLRFFYARPWEKNDQSTSIIFRISTSGQPKH